MIFVFVGQDPIGLERSLVSDYKAKLVKKKGEVVQLLREREELKATQKQLLNLQKKMNHKQVSWIWGILGQYNDGRYTLFIAQFLDDSLQDHEVFSQTYVGHFNSMTPLILRFIIAMSQQPLGVVQQSRVTLKTLLPLSPSPRI